MILKNLQSIPKTNPEELIRLRDSIYAADLLITAITHLDFFSWLENNPSDFDSIINAFKIKPGPADVMLTLFKAQKLIHEERGIYQITNLAKEHLTTQSDWSLNPYYATQKERPTVNKMLEVLKTGIPANWGAKEDELEWEKAMEKSDFADKFTRGMDSRGAYLAPALAAGFDFSKYNSIIDIAGASGIYAACIKSKYPQIKAALLEKPPVNKIAKIGLSKRNLENDIEIYGANMFQDNIPPGYDIHLFSHVLHDWNIEQNKQLIKNSFKNLNSNGIIMIHDAHINHDKTGPLSVAEYSVLLMFSTYGKCYSTFEIEKMLKEEGFTDIKYQQTAANRSIITGKKS